MQGASINSELNENGIHQRNAFYNKYKNIAFDAVLTSQLQRTQQTVAPFNHPTTVSTSLLGELNSGIYDGKKLDESFDKNYWNIVHEWLKGNAEARFPEGESFEELKNRIVNVKHLIDKSDWQTILICTHGRTMRTILHVFTGIHFNNVQQYKFNNTGLYLLSGIVGAMQIEKANNLDHLQ